MKWLLFLLFSLANFNSFILRRHYKVIDSLFPSTWFPLSATTNIASEVDSNSFSTISLKDEVVAIIESIFEISNDEIGFESVNTAALMQYMYLLAKGRLYEEVMNDKIKNAADLDEVKKLEAIHGHLRIFVIAERKSRARLKLNYILAGATSKRLEDCISLLSESDEIDDDLVSYINSLIQKENNRMHGKTKVEDDEEKLLGAGKETIDVLQMIQRRLVAQLKSKDREDLKLLAMLLYEADPKKRMNMMKSTLTKVETLESFEQLVQDGIVHILQQVKDKVEKVESNPMFAGKTQSRQTESSSLSLEKMRDLLQDIKGLQDKLVTGFNNDTAFSTMIDKDND